MSSGLAGPLSISLYPTPLASPPRCISFRASNFTTYASEGKDEGGGVAEALEGFRRAGMRQRNRDNVLIGRRTGKPPVAMMHMQVLLLRGRHTRASEEEDTDNNGCNIT